MSEKEGPTLNTEQLLLMMVAHAGNANAKVFDALDAYESGNLKAAMEILEDAGQELLSAQKNQFALMNEEAQGKEVVPSILMIHAMDICMTAANSIQYTKRLLPLLQMKHEMS